MVQSASGVNPIILKWARLRSGYELEDVAHRLKKDISIVKAWEAGDRSPTYIQLEKLAYQLYKRPIALFFFPEPPDEPDPIRSFRTLPGFEVDNLSSDTRFAIRQAEAMQISLRELNDGTNPSKNKIFKDLKADPGIEISSFTHRVRNYLGIILSEQKAWKTAERAFKAWRHTIQEKGIFIFKRAFKQRDISGFCLLDEQFPVIYVNNSTPFTRQIFTLFHELAHILLDVNGVSKIDDRYTDWMYGYEKELEIFSNKFAGEFLVPSEDFEKHLRRGDLDDLSISRLANIYQVSREVILRKLFDKGAVSQERYEIKRNEWIKQYQKRGAAGSGGNYYATQATYLGEKYLNLAFARYYEGRCSIEQLSDYLNVKAKNIPKLEPLILRQASI